MVKPGAAQGKTKAGNPILQRSDTRQILSKQSDLTSEQTLEFLKRAVHRPIVASDQGTTDQKIFNWYPRDESAFDIGDNAE
jgi:hypothetical protein